MNELSPRITNRQKVRGWLIERSLCSTMFRCAKSSFTLLHFLLDGYFIFLNDLFVVLDNVRIIMSQNISMILFTLIISIFSSDASHHFSALHCTVRYCISLYCQILYYLVLFYTTLHCSISLYTKLQIPCYAVSWIWN